MTTNIADYKAGAVRAGKRESYEMARELAGEIYEREMEKYGDVRYDLHDQEDFLRAANGQPPKRTPFSRELMGQPERKRPWWKFWGKDGD